MDPAKEKYRRVRGAILKLLAYEHPRPVDFHVLHIMLDNLNYTISEDEMDSHVSYLAHASKGYVLDESRACGQVRVRMITITPKGLDLLDEFGEEHDHGVDVRF